ncbi:hypothetical protein ACEQPO_23885 [Bacillus sp. SL00103]
MANRSETDQLEAFPNKYVTYSGSEWGTYRRCAVFRRHVFKELGRNDGAVTVNSTNYHMQTIS